MGLCASTLLAAGTLVLAADPPAEAQPADGSPATAEAPAAYRAQGKGTGGQDATGPGKTRPEKVREERDLALAATWHVDPYLLRPHPTDSVATLAAREQLAAIDERLAEVMETYDAARAASRRAAAAAQAATEALTAARAAQRQAEIDYRRDRELLVSAIGESYSMSGVGALSLVLTAESDDDLVSGMTVLEELGRVQTDAVEAAERSRDRLQAATVAVAAAEQEAQERLQVAQDTLAEADEARRAVLRDVRTARRVVRESAVADRAARDTFAGGYDGAIAFPLPPGTAYVDQDNFGRRSKHWASVHTGDDFSAACGTPVRAVTDGTVILRTDQQWSGPWLVMVSTGEGALTTWYAHMQALDVVHGQRVHAGDRIGLVGQRGNATGCHLHFEVHPSGGSIYQDDTDPAAWLRAVGAYPSGG